MKKETIDRIRRFTEDRDWDQFHSPANLASLSVIREQSARAAEAVCEAAHLRKGDLFVVGCSSSEVIGDQIGTNSSIETAEAVFEGIYGTLQKRGIFLAVQCCEHLNRALIVEREACMKFDLEEVNVIPQPKAGGSFATTAYKGLQIRWRWNPCARRPLRAWMLDAP